MVKEAIKKADVLIEALPYIKEFHKCVFVIKYGGSILGEERVRKSVLEDIAFLRYSGIRPILVHGGGPNITGRLKELKVQTEFVDGLRVTDQATLDVVGEELDKLNDLIVDEINSHHSLAQGFKSKDGLLFVKKKDYHKELGFVGEIVDCDYDRLVSALNISIPVITPMGITADGTVYNINADDVAYFIAAKLKAEKLVLLTDVLGVMRQANDETSLFPSLTLDQIDGLIKDKVIAKGMIPKVMAAVRAIEKGVKKSHIVDAKISHALLLEIFTDQGVGTEIIL